MSHVVTIKTKITDKMAMLAAFKRLGGTFVENTQSFRWWGRHVGDYPLPQGFRVEDMGTCHHKVIFPGCTYEVGIIEINKLPLDHPARQFHKADEFVPIYDFIHHPLSVAMGGAKASKFVQAYAVEKARLAARRKGATFKETVGTDGKVTIEVTQR